MTDLGPRRIIHVDMDAFYASVEQRDDPSLRGKPLVVGGSPEGRGVVAAASYEARRHGIRSAMPMARAVRLCPELVIVPPDFPRYRDASKRVFAIFRRVTPLVEPLSIDEAYLDVTVNDWAEPFASRVAKRLKAEILAETGLTASAGVAPNKMLAKIASGWRKPDGLTVIPTTDVDRFLQRLPVKALAGVGPVTAARLARYGLTRLVELRDADPAVLASVLGAHAASVRRMAFGHDDRPVVPDRPAKSASRENTYAEDLHDPERIRLEIERMALDLAGWLERRAVWARTLVVKVRYSDFTTITRSHTSRADRDAAALAARAQVLTGRTDAGRRPVRLLGVGVHNLVDAPTDEAAPANHPLPFA